MEPYYIIMRLPDEEKEEFLLMLPFTPVGNKVTIGWLPALMEQTTGSYWLTFSPRSGR
jgi:hypothetical protein